MDDLPDGYGSYYAERLWQSLPEMYRALDTPSLGTPGLGATGPLRELVNRIGTQIAVVRRSIDGLWADQSIEACADWAIPYIGDLVATRLAPGLDARGQRLDVAFTIGWRRRKGTLTTVDAVARGVTGWGIHVVEGFRRLARTRHNLDPPVGVALLAGAGSTPGADLLEAEGLVAPHNRTPAGGFADLRSAPGTLLTGGPFGQAFHHADLRRGTPAAGWYGIEKLVVYCWRLLTFPVVGATPVRVAGRADEYVFDPTGREIPLFLPPLQDASKVTGTSREWQVPGPVSAALLRVMTAAGVPAPYQVTGGTADSVQPETGRFRLRAPTGGTVGTSYYYGFGGPIGAGSAGPRLTAPLYVAGEIPVSGGSGLSDALLGARSGDTVTIGDSRTYTAVSAVTAAPGATAPLTVRARPGQRPVIRLAEQPSPWVFTGGEGARLTLDGLFVSGGDIVLRGSFDQVTIVGCTLDPGTLAPGARRARPGERRGGPEGRRGGPGDRRRADALATSADGRALVPTRVWIEATPGRATPLRGQPAPPPDVIRCLEVDHCILGPIRTRNGGLAENVTISDSIVQGFRASAGASFTPDDVFDPVLLYDQLSPGRPEAGRPRAQPNPLSAFIWRLAGGDIPAGARRQLLARQAAPAASALAAALNRLLGRGIYRPERFGGVTMSPESRRLSGFRGAVMQRWLDRLLLEDAYPLALAPAACAVADATVTLNRVTILGRLVAHRLRATDSILHGFAVVEDPEDGCVRYSAALDGSRLPRQHNSARLLDGAAVFTSTAFGRPGYGQLLETADRAVTTGAPGTTLLAGASSGSQMGAFSAQIVPIKDRALRMKYSEYLPLGLTPVVVHVT